VAGVRTLRIEQRDTAGTRLAELWVEPTRGLTLQMRRWADAQTVAWAWQVNAYRFDQPPPDDWAAPHLTTWPQRFWDTAHEGLPPLESEEPLWLGRGLPGRAAPTPLPTAATEVDVAAARLAFAYPPDFAAGRAPGYAEEVTVTVLADGTMVGKFPLPATTDLICSRAGTTLALTAGYWTEHQGGEWVYLLDLGETAAPRRDVFVGGRVLRLALAPDGKTAALVVRENQINTQLVLLDTVSGQQKNLLPGAAVSWVVWNPRGSLLAVWAMLPGAAQAELVVLLRATGEIVERRLLGNSLAIPADSQVASWGVRPLPNALPFYAYGLTDCVQP
jgi:hypothetical protein